MAKPLGNYVPAVRSGSLLFLSGQVSARGDDPVTGKIDAEQTPQRGYEAARAVADGLLRTLEGELGSLDRVVRIVSVAGFVNASPDFAEIPQVINGASDRLVEVLGERGRHARLAVGAASLPLNSSVEVQLVAEVRD